MQSDELLDRIERGVALRSDDAGIRINAQLQPAGGPGTKVFPPTYAFDDVYVTEPRFRNQSDGPSATVLLDAQQSQANRAEEALSEAIDDGALTLPHLRVEGLVEGWPITITNLTAPHRGPDAYFRDSEAADGTAFDKTDVGKALRRADARNATAFFDHVPSDLLFGFWDSQRGGRGVKVPRSYTSEIIGWDWQPGVRAAGRIDPNNIEKVEIIFPDKHPEEFRVAEEAEKAKKDEKKLAPSKVGHGNIPPSKQRAGGGSIASAERLAYLSFAGLHRLRFPAAGATTSTPERDVAARTVLAALALYADRLAFRRPTLLLRSGCELVVTQDTVSWLDRTGSTTPFEIDIDTAHAALAVAVERATAVGLSWSAEPVRLRPKANLTQLLAATFTRYAEVE